VLCKDIPALDPFSVFHNPFTPPIFNQMGPKFDCTAHYLLAFHCTIANRARSDRSPISHNKPICDKQVTFGSKQLNGGPKKGRWDTMAELDA
jgi:hypothetical protein